MRLYKRSITVIVGEDDGTAVKVQNLFIEFEMNKESVSTPNEGTVRISNLNESTETQIRERGVRIRVTAGYDGDEALLFDGDIRKVEKERRGLDRVTVITLGGNVFKVSNAEFIKSYEGPVSLKTIVTDAVPSFNLTVGSLDEVPDNVFLNDFAWSGRTSDMLNRILQPNNIQWFETDGQIGFSKRRKARDTAIYIINSETGMVGSPTITDKGLRVKTLLNPRLRINGRVKIESDILGNSARSDDESARAGEYQGVYKINKIRHTGDNRKGMFQTEILVTPLDTDSQT